MLLSHLLACLVVPLSVHAHAGHHHEHGASEPTPGQKAASLPRSALERINERYVKDIKPMFGRQCMACHGGAPEYPWYYSLPGIHQMIDSDIEEAHEHLDMRRDFPFGGHGTPREDLQAIKEDVLSGEMPPFAYRLMHSEARMTDAEKKAVADWVDESLGLLPPEDNKK